MAGNISSLHTDVACTSLLTSLVDLRLIIAVAVEQVAQHADVWPAISPRKLSVQQIKIVIPMIQPRAARHVLTERVELDDLTSHAALIIHENSEIDHVAVERNAWVDDLKRAVDLISDAEHVLNALQALERDVAMILRDGS